MGDTAAIVLGPPPVVDINEYFGTWYEVGSVKQFFSIGLVNTTAVYSLNPDGSIKVENSGNYFVNNGPQSTITGVALPVDPTNPAAGPAPSRCERPKIGRYDPLPDQLADLYSRPGDRGAGGQLRIQQWWREPDHFDWTTQFLSQRGLLRSTQIVMAIVASSAALVPLSFLGGLRLPLVPLLALGVVGAIITVGLTAFWLTRWPTRRQSEAAAVTGTLFIALWSLAQPSPAVALLACTATAVTGGYIAFFHSTKLLLFNFAVAIAITTTASWRLANDSNVGTAIAASSLVCILNLTVPLAIRVMARAMGTYAMRSDADPLTGLLNRRGFAHRISSELQGSHPTDSNLTLVMVDLDDFKRINDTHGHAVGDRVLKAVAELLWKHSPPSAAICRAGGEEFLIAVTTDDSTANMLAAQLCTAIAALPHDVTASLGTSRMPLEKLRGRKTETPLDDLIAAADASMYAAKRNGGNQVTHG